MRLLPADRRDALFAVYALARRIDDVADGDLPAGREARRARARCASELDRLGREPRPGARRASPTPRAASRSRSTRSASSSTAPRWTCAGTDYATFAELELLLPPRRRLDRPPRARRLRCSRPRRAREPLADDLGVALQLDEHPARPERGRARTAASTCRARTSSASAAASPDGRIDGPGRAARRVRGAARARLARARARRSCRCSTAAARPASSRWPARTAGCWSGSRPTRRSCCDGRPVAAPLGEGLGARAAASRGARRDAARASRSSAAASPGSPPRSNSPTPARRSRSTRRARGSAAPRTRSQRERPLDRQRPARRCCAAAPPTSASSTRLGVERPRADAAAAAHAGAARGQAAGVPRRAPLPAPLHLVPTLLRYPLLLGRASASPRCAPPPRCGKLDPDDAGARRSGRSATGCARTASPTPRSTELWNLIALPTLNLHAGRGVARRSRRRSSAPACSTPPTLPTSASRPCRCSGCTATRRRPRSSAPACASRSGRRCARVGATDELQLDDGADDVDAVDRRRAARRGRRTLLPTAPSTRTRSTRLGSSPIVNLHVHYDRRVLDEPFAAAAAGRRCSGSSTAPTRPASPTGQLVAVSLSARRRDIGEPSPTLRERYLPALERLLPAARDARGARLHRRRASRARPSAPRPAAAACGPARARACPASTSPAPGPTPGWPATMESAVRSGARGRRAPRSPTSPPAGSARRSSREARRMTRRRPSPRARRRATRRSSARATHLLSLQHRDGWWKGELETNVTIDAEDLFLRHFLGIRRRRGDRGDRALDPLEAARRRHLGDLLRRPRRPLDHGRGVRRAAARGRSGRRRAHARARPRSSATAAASSARASSRACGCRCSRLWSWDEVPAIPPELILLPPRAPLSHLLVRLLGAADDRGARRSCSALRPATRCRSAIDELRTRRRAAAADRRRGAGRSTLLDRGLHRYERPPGRAAAPPRRCGTAERWIVERQEARRLVGRHPAAVGVVDDRACTRSATRSTTPCSRARSPGSTASRSRTSTAAGSRRASRRSGTRRSRVIALLDAGLAPDARRRSSAARAGSPAARCASAATGRCGGRTLEPGGFPFEFANDNYPDVDDTAVVVLALRRAAARPATARAADRGLAWSLGMQSSDGGWGAFDVDNTSGLPLKLPFCDFGAVIDPPSADVTAHMVEMLGVRGHARASRRRSAGIDWLLREQERGRLVVRPLGREPRLRHRRRRAGARGVRACATHPSVRAAVALARARAERRRRLRRGPPLVPRRRLARARRVDRVADRLGAARAPRGGRARAAAVERAVELAGRDAAAATASWDEPLLHRHRLPGRLLHQLPPLPAGVPGDGARPDPRSDRG